VDNGTTNGRVDRWVVDTTDSVSFMSVTAQCYSLFMDHSNTLYCAVTLAHQVVKKWFGDNSTVSTTVVGTGTAGSATNQLYYPAGVFVDLNFTLFVGDCFNNRIQKFAFGETNGVTIVGNGLASSSPFTFNCPATITFDANGYIFFTDCYNNRLFGSGPLGLRCLFGCSMVAGSAANQLNLPNVFAFDSDGNIFLADQNNHRIQRFLLVSNSCSECLSV
jgi:NHL repeat